LLRTQLRAVLRAAVAGNVEVMFPMVASLDEVRAARAILDEERRSLPARVPVGIMIEVPAAAVLAAELAREVDFFSIGTNDLTQYTLAMDRGHPSLARYADALNPAVLHMIDMTVIGARRHGRRVGVCGGLASDPLAAPLLVGLGVNELSVDVRAVAPVKAALARFTLAECHGIARQALTLATTAEVRGLLGEHAAASAEQAP
jgi:phosphocarrier protein FPr/phosphocarrier protein